MSYWVMWLVIVILLTIIEASTVNLVSIWFIASGIVSLFVSLFATPNKKYLNQKNAKS